MAKAHSLDIAPLASTIANQRQRSSDLVCHVQAVSLGVSAEHLQWIVTELVDNALKFSQPQTEVTVRGEVRDRVFQLWIDDRGRGMTQAQIASIGAFMQFERQTYEQQGAGLGLKIVQKTVELYGGRLLISSIHHQETSVHLTLPLATANSLSGGLA